MVEGARSAEPPTKLDICGATALSTFPEVFRVASASSGANTGIASSHPAGRFLLEVYAGAWFFSDNDEFLGTRTFSQDPLYTIQVHVGYSFPKGIWIAMSSRQSLGGAARVDIGEKTDPESNNRLGLTFNVPLGKGFSLKLAATTGVTATVGNDYDTFVAVLQKAW